jgi:hypothetical protein
VRNDVVRALHKAAETGGYRASFLTDNGLIFTTERHHHLAGVTEQELFALGIEAKHSRPYHPQTCGKVERFHQTMKKFLAMQDITSPKQLQRQLDRFVDYYDEVRPHRGIGRQTPAAVYSAREKAGPSPSFVKVGDRRLRFDRGRLHRIGIGNAYAGWRVAMLVDGLDIEIVGFDGSPLRRLILDPTKDYQRIP